MTIAFDTTSALGQSSAASSNAAQTVGVLTNGYLLVGLVYQNNTSSPTSVNWNTSETMTLLAGPTTLANSERGFIYGLANPTSGSHNVTVAKAADGVFVSYYGVSYSGVKSTGQPDSTASNTGTTTSLTTTTTSILDNCWLFGVWRGLGASQAAGANTTLRGTGGGAIIVSDTNTAQTPAGSHAMTVTQTSSAIGGLIISFSPFVAQTTNASFLLNMI